MKENLTKTIDIASKVIKWKELEGTLIADILEKKPEISDELQTALSTVLDLVIEQQERVYQALLVALNHHEVFGEEGAEKACYIKEQDDED